jgi:hypothetical protein
MLLMEWMIQTSRYGVKPPFHPRTHEWVIPDPEKELAHRETELISLVSGYKSKSCNWLHVGSSDIRNFAGENACESSIFSKRLTLRICNIV